ncbi:MAG TPA: pantoate--beta-alanine ligase, partial [Chitinophagaceae bacterium]|nr:pantoate--beta-alanine ligase [Chitinophagaceae bacterium]
ICSIFINPTQFNNKEDFKYYPVTIEKDIELLLVHGCGILFLPELEEIYTKTHLTKPYALGDLENILEGHYRPGHFQGVCQVVDRLLEIVEPDQLYIGQKDFQQCKVISKLIELKGKADQISINIVPTVREKNGLAMSSRNLRLSKAESNKAKEIYGTLVFIKQNLHIDINELKKTSIKKLEEKDFVVDYVEIANADNLHAAKHLNQPLIALIAASINKIRLIDNMILN